MVRLTKSLGYALLAGLLTTPAVSACAQTAAPQASASLGSAPAASQRAATSPQSAQKPATVPQAMTSAKPVTTPASTVSATPGSHSRSHHKRVAAAPEPEAPQPPPPPPTLEQSPPTPPQVSYRNGELTIDATNSTLSQVLHAVQQQTGASIDIPSSAGGDRVVAQLGPGQPRDVLNTLLHGSKFDYVILGVNGNPGAIQKVILTQRQGGAMGSTSSAQSSPQSSPAPVAEDEPEPDEGVANVEQPEPQYQNPDQAPPPPPGGFRRPMPGQVIDPGAAFNNGGEQQNGTKSPEQLMQELQQMQQQQQQYQEQLNPANRGPQ